MGATSKYWCLVCIDGSGRRRSKEIELAKTFLYQQCLELIHGVDSSDATLQLQLLDWVRQKGAVPSAVAELIAQQDAAELCLRCFISHQIEQMCVRLEQQFGSRYGFTRNDLFPFVLDDDGQLKSRRQATHHRPVTILVLETFDASRANLNTWTMRLVRNHRELNNFLREQGVYLASDWSILNDTSPDQARRILSKFHTLTGVEVEQAAALLLAYHLIYRQDRLQLRQTGALRGKEHCKPPTPDQLSRISEYLGRSLSLSPQAVLTRLQALATQLREYRVFIRSGSLSSQSLDDPETRAIAASLASSDADELEQEEQSEFLKRYRQQFLDCLDEALQQVTRDRFSYLQRKKGQKGEQFLTALYLFHCRGQAMGDIAPQVQLKAQFEVTRLIKLKEFRATVRQRLLDLLKKYVFDTAKNFIDAQKLHSIDHQIEVALDEQISIVIQQAEAESVVTKHRPLESLFARRLCRHLDIERNVT